MAEVQRLEYRFTERGLSDLRDGMQALTEDVEDAGAEAEQTAARMEAAGEDMEDSVEGVTGEVESLQRALNSITSRDARRSLSRLEDAIDGTNFDSLANSALQASALIQSEMEDTEDSLVGVGIAGLEVGQAVESGAEDGEEAYEDLTQQVLAAKAAIESVDGFGPETNVDLQARGQGGGGSSVGFGTVAAAVGLKEVLENTTGTGAKIGELSDSAEELEDAATQLRLAAVAIGEEAGVNMPVYVDDVANTGDDGDDGDDGRRRSSTSLAHGFHGLARALGNLTASIPPAVKKLAAMAAVGGAVVLGLGAFDIAAATAATGLTALATKLALDYGTEELKRDLQAVGAQYKETAERFVQAFEPILRDAVIPALQTFNRWLRANIDGLKGFVTERIPQMREFVGSIMFLMQAVGRLGDALSSSGLAGAVSDGLQFLATQLFILADVIEWMTGGSEEQPAEGPEDGARLEPRTDENGATVLAPSESGGDKTSTSTSSGVDRSALLGDRLGPIMNSQAKQIARIRQRAAKDLISQEEMLRQIVSARETAFQELQKLAQKFPSLSDALINFLAGQVKDARQKLGKATLQNATEQPADASKVDPAQSTRFPLLPSVGDQLDNRAPQQLSGPGGGLSALQGAAKGADSIGDINSLIEATRKQFDTLNNEEARDFIGRLQTAREEMKSAKAQAEALRDVAVQSFRRLADGIGQSLGGALFADQGTVQRLKDRRRNIQQNLRQAREAGNFEQVRQLSKELSKVNNKLDKTQSFFGRLGEAFRNFGNIAKQVLEQLISKLISAATIAAVLGPVLGVSSAGFGSIFGAVLGGGKIPGLAEGGIVKDSTLAMVGEGTESEAVMPLSKLETLIQPATPSAQPAASTGGANVNVNVGLEAEARMRGSDLVVGLRKALNEEAAVGGLGTL